MHVHGLEARKRRESMSGTPEKIVQNLVTNLEILESRQAKQAKEVALAEVRDRISTDLATLKIFLDQDFDTEPTDESREEVALELNKGELLKIIFHLSSFDFEGKKRRDTSGQPHHPAL